MSTSYAVFCLKKKIDRHFRLLELSMIHRPLGGEAIVAQHARPVRLARLSGRRGGVGPDGGRRPAGRSRGGGGRGSRRGGERQAEWEGYPQNLGRRDAVNQSG